MKEQLKHTQVFPNEGTWRTFIEHTVKYLEENWLEKTQVPDFEKKYERTLQSRCDENRGLFLYTANGTLVGLANAYVDQDSLNIAEFCVLSQFRKQGYGREIVMHLLEWGRSRGVHELRIEVDKHLIAANAFWSKFGYNLDQTTERNLYTSRF